MAHTTDVTTEARDIVLTRRFDAPRALVFMAWTDPAMLTAWWGPKSLPTTGTLDVREGGAFTLVMHGSDGTDYPIDGRFGEIVPNALLVMIMTAKNHPPEWHDLIRKGFVEAGGAPEDYNADPIETRVVFEDDGEGTKITVRQIFTQAAMRDAHLNLGNGVGWSESFEKLDAVLAVQV